MKIFWLCTPFSPQLPWYVHVERNWSLAATARVIPAVSALTKRILFKKNIFLKHVCRDPFQQVVINFSVARSALDQFPKYSCPLVTLTQEHWEPGYRLKNTEECSLWITDGFWKLLCCCYLTFRPKKNHPKIKALSIYSFNILDRFYCCLFGHVLVVHRHQNLVWFSFLYSSAQIRPCGFVCFRIQRSVSKRLCR